MTDRERLRLTDLLDREVEDEDGKPIGRIFDVRLLQDGPYVAGFGAALRVDGLVVGSTAIGVRLGFHRPQVKGPWPIKPVLAALARKSRHIPWDDVVAWEDGPVRVRNQPP